MNIPGEPLTAGSITTTPAGFEERFMPAIPSGMRQWSNACAGDAALPADGMVEIRLRVGADGVVRAADAVTPGALASCFAAQALQARLRDVTLTQEVGVNVRGRLAR